MSRNPSPAEREPFTAGEAHLAPAMRRMQKLDGGLVALCRAGRARLTIDLKPYDLTADDSLIVLPGSVLNTESASDDFRIAYVEFDGEIFREASVRLESTFFHFVKENPCYAVPPANRGPIDLLLWAAEGIYADRENRFRLQILKNHLQSFLLDLYDKSYRLFTRQQIEGRNRQDELFKRFMALVHEYCTSQREVSFYAERLCISTKYLTSICRGITGHSAKKIIDNFVILEIKALLQSGELNIQEIADRLGFPDQSYLGRYFKRHVGVSPREY